MWGVVAREDVCTRIVILQREVCERRGLGAKFDGLVVASTIDQ